MSRDVRKPDFCICQNKDADQLGGNREDDAFVFAKWIVQSLYFLNPKFRASSYLLWFPSPVCIGPGRKPRGPVFWHRSSNTLHCFIGSGSKAICNNLFGRPWDGAHPAYSFRNIGSWKYLSRNMRKPDFCICEIKDADQLRGNREAADQLRGYREADLRLCFRICKNPVFSRRGSFLKAIKLA